MTAAQGPTSVRPTPIRVVLADDGVVVDLVDGRASITGRVEVGRVYVDGLSVGDRVWFRHAKAGEVYERFPEVHLVRGETLERTVPTYRGEGRTFG